MRRPRLFLFFPLKIGEDQKKRGLQVRRCRVFTKNIGEDQKKKVFVVCDEAPRFLRDPPFPPRP